MVSDRLKGIAVTATGVLVLSPDSLLIRLIHVDPLTLLFYRGLLLWATLAAYTAFRARGAVWAAFRAMGRPGALAAVFLAGSTLCFVLAVRHTLVANVLVIVGAAPLFAALFSRVFLSERIPARTWLAVLAALLGIAVTASGSLGTDRLPGDLCALGTACFIAGQFTALRRASPGAGPPSVATGGLIAAAVAFPFASPLSVSAGDLGYLLVLGCVVLPVSFGLIATGPRYLPAPEVGLLTLMEMVLGPFWVWLALSERPALASLVGGAVVLLTVCTHAVVSLRRAGQGSRLQPDNGLARAGRDSRDDFSP